MREDEIKALDMNGCLAKIAELRAVIEPKVKKLATLTYNEAYELEHRYMKPIEAIQRRISGLKAAETRRVRRMYGR